MLSALGEDSIIILSTHIVEDVSELCTRMAIINDGEILLGAEPLRAIEDIRGRVWRKLVAKEDVASLERDFAVISTKMLAGRTFVNDFSDTRPGDGFEPVEPDLKDVYFSAMGGHYRSTPTSVATGADATETTAGVMGPAGVAS